jgi:hypothetical protein
MGDNIITDVCPLLTKKWFSRGIAHVCWNIFVLIMLINSNEDNSVITTVMHVCCTSVEVAGTSAMENVPCTNWVPSAASWENGKIQRYE